MKRPARSVWTCHSITPGRSFARRWGHCSTKPPTPWLTPSASEPKSCMAEPTIRIEVVYAAVDRQELLALDVPVGTTVRVAATMSGLGERFPEVDIEGCPLGIFGKVVDDPDRRELAA